MTTMPTQPTLPQRHLHPVPVANPQNLMGDDGTSFIEALFELMSRADVAPARAVLDLLERELDGEAALLGVDAEKGQHVLALGRRASGAPGVHETVAVAEVDDGPGVARLLVIRGANRPGEAGFRALHRAAQALAVLRTRSDTLAVVREEQQAELLVELLSVRGRLSPSTRSLASLRGFDLDRPHVVVVLGAARSPRSRTDTIVADVARHFDGIGGRFGGVLVAVLPADDERSAATDLARRFRRLTGEQVGVCASLCANPVTGGLAAAFDSARHGLALLMALDRPHRVATSADLSLYRALFDAGRAAELGRFVDEVLRPLRDYDRDHQADLLTTVRVFLAEGGNAARTARTLFVHANTMTKRLDRVAQVLGPDWRDEPTNLRLRLALHLDALPTLD